MNLPSQSLREPPHNFEAEQALLGAILLNNSGLSVASEIVQAQHFADPLHGRLFDMLGRLIERGQVVSAFTLKTFAEADEDLKKAGGPTYIARLAAASAHVHSVADFARTVRECAVRRGIIAATSEAAAAAYDESLETPCAEQIERLEHQLYTLAEGTTGDGFQPLSRGLTEAVKTAEAAHKRGGGLSGITTGFRDLDELLGGLHPSDLSILASRPGMGKTALATNIAFAAAESAVPVGFFSLEMSAEQLCTRIVSEHARVASERIRGGKVTSAEMDRIIEAAGKLEQAPFFIDDTGAMTIGGLRTRARRLKRQHGLGLIVVDYLQLLVSTSKRENRVQEVSEISRGLKALAKELDLPVLALSQLSRKVEERSDKRPQLADLRESGSIEQDADVVMFIYREEYYRKLMAQDYSDVAGKAELNIAKHRQGPTGLVNLEFEGAATCFRDIDRSDR